MTRAEIKAAWVFLTVAFLAAGALGAAQPATRIPTEVVQLTQFGPALGVGLVALVWPGVVRALFSGRGAGRRGPALAATAVLIIAASAAAYGALSGDARFTRPSALEHPFALIVVAQFIGACGEEIGWRCFLQPLLGNRFGPFVSSVVVGAVWGVWHVQVFAQDPVYAGAFLLGAVSMSVVLGWALEGTGAAVRLPLAGGFHALINLGMLLFMDEESGAVPPMVLFGASCLVAAAVWTVARARKATVRIHPILDHAR
ncbi:CPBP family intramembrane glutamic endopeptidase [Streptomyces hesseae]|uniref:CPBP family intramembrane glutamic endopeptidase n=1 Tax=Streptomyces hesseae TaxID=3075519 RepID=A0ABU2SP64_9ACTN|nr:CPBP family intramembrane glutamic endopeptidase [Streptomyces sp. DSM 40473]MDT0450767.1 CPBP family intramembrane glutamic endopeptidase [Streptomyces sp. DSM 40473]